MRLYSRWSPALMASVVSVLLLPLRIFAQDIPEPEANPGRPTVSTPASLTPVGYLQFETGALGAEHSAEFSNRASIEETIKFAISTRVQFLVVSEPLVRSDTGSVTETDPGGVALGTQIVLFPPSEGRPTLSLSYMRTVYDGSAPDLDTGLDRNILFLLISGDIRKFHIDSNYFFNQQVNGDVSRLQTGQTLSVAHPLAGKFAFTGEIWHFTQPFLKGHAVGLLLGPTYAVNKRLVLDAGFNRGLTDTSTRWEFFAGFTYLLPKKLWFR